MKVRTKNSPVGMRMSAQGIIKKLHRAYPHFSRTYNVRSLGLFGSVVRGDVRRSSDVDILVQFRKTPGFFEFLALEDELSELVGARVDLVEKKSLKPAIGKRVLRETVRI